MGRQNFYFIILSLVVYFTQYNFAQQDSTGIETNQILEDILQESNEESDNEALFNTYEELVNNPVNINKADIQTLQTIPFVDFSSAEIIFNHRKKYGKYFSKEELYSVKNLPDNLVKKILPFISVEKVKEYSGNNSSSFINNYNIDFRSRSINDLQMRKGFRDNKFSGSAAKFYNRIKIKYNKNFEAGFLAEKDPGENNLNDFSSFHFSVKDWGIINYFVAGDYLVQFGQGLALWSPYAISKGADAVYPVKRKHANIKSYTSADENKFLRGAAVNLSLTENINLTAFISKNKFDANLDSVSYLITSTPVDGMHRTVNEIDKRKKGEENLLGFEGGYSNDFFSIGILYYHSKFNEPFSPSSSGNLRGNNFNFYSLNYDLIWRKLNFFGEAAFDGNSIASLNGMQIVISRNFSFITSFRYYPTSYKNLHGFGFGERSGATKNELGLYTGIKWKTFLGIINFYYDQFKFPAPTFRIPLPSSGNEFLFNLTSKPFKKVETRIRYKNENKESVIKTGNSDKVVKTLTQIIRAEFIYEVSKELRLKGRFEYKNIFSKNSLTKEDGFLFLQDILVRPFYWLNFYGRIIFFNTASFSTAIYEYENDLPGILSNTALYDNGTRWYFIFKIKPYKYFTITGKYSETIKPYDKSIGSGYSEIEGGLDNRFSFQLDFNF